ncbi:MAG: hypothetical protein QF615_11885, partial [Planctomycetota bacterium]|nr:hypothetical protein [Planctomycetota bacterium]
FAFDTVDNMWNGGRGWFIDDLLVRECAVPSSFCLAAPNSAGAGGALMGYTGTNVVSLNNLRLHATGCPPNQFALFIYSAGQAQTPLGDGFLCLTSPIHRLYPLAQTGGGTPSHVLDLGSPPSAAGQISPGETWNFQCWYRDPAAGVAGFNLSDGLGVAFCP